MLFSSGNPFKCHEEILYLQPLIPPKRFDIFPPLTGGCSEGLGAFCFFFKHGLNWQFIQILQHTTGVELYSSTGSMYINSGKHHRRKVEEKLCVTFLLCDPGWYVHKPDVQNKWYDNITHNTHTDLSDFT